MFFFITQQASDPAAQVALLLRIPSRVKLPKLHLKKFNGDPTCWQQFWESFNCAVHENTVLSSIDKFNYLLGPQNTALQAISGLSLSGDNYIEAVKILQDRFGNKPLIISKHMDKLLKLPSVSSLRDAGPLLTYRLGGDMSPQPSYWPLQSEILSPPPPPPVRSLRTTCNRWSTSNYVSK